MASTPEFIARFREMHERAKKGALTPAERADYEQSRRDLGRFLLVAQQISHGGKTLRAALRIAQLLKIELDLGGAAPERTSTIDLASGGFAVLLPMGQPIGRVASFVLYLPGIGATKRPIEGRARVASSRPQGSLQRVSFSFEELAPDARELLEIAIIDAVLSRFTAPL